MAKPKEPPNPYFSIIVPVHFFSEETEKCFDSLLKQTFCDFEVIIVDNSETNLQLPRRLSMDNRFIRFPLCHCPAGTARNAGLNVARGMYVSFVDSDDTVAEDYLEVAHAFLVQEKVEILYTSVGSKENGKRRRYTLSKPDDIKRWLLPAFPKLSGKPDLNIPVGPVWSKFYLRSFLSNQHISFLENTYYGEDLAFSFSCIYKCCRFGFLPDYEGYFYNTHDPYSKITLDQLPLIRYYYQSLIQSALNNDADLPYLAGTARLITIDFLCYVEGIIRRRVLPFGKAISFCVSSVFFEGVSVFDGVPIEIDIGEHNAVLRRLISKDKPGAISVISQLEKKKVLLSFFRSIKKKACFFRKTRS